MQQQNDKLGIRTIKIQNMLVSNGAKAKMENQKFFFFWIGIFLSPLKLEPRTHKPSPTFCRLSKASRANTQKTINLEYASYYHWG